MMIIRSLLVSVFVVGVSVAQLMTLTQSTANNTITPLTSIACTNGAVAPQYHAENSYFRAYNITTSGLTAPVEITCIRFALEFALSNPANIPAGTQPLNIRLYRTLAAGAVWPAALPGAPQRVISFNQPDVGPAGAIFVRGVNPPLMVSPGDLLIVELNLPDGIGPMNVCFPGSNSLGEAAPTYLRSVPCGIGAPTPVVNVAPAMAPAMHIILDAQYIPVGSSIPPVVSVQVTPNAAMPGMSDAVVTNENLIPGREIWNFYSSNLCPGGAGTGPLFGMCISMTELLDQLNTPLGLAPLHYTASDCRQTFGAITLPTGLTFDVICVDFNSATGAINGWSPVVRVQF